MCVRILSTFWGLDLYLNEFYNCIQNMNYILKQKQILAFPEIYFETISSSSCIESLVQHALVVVWTICLRIMDLSCASYRTFKTSRYEATQGVLNLRRRMNLFTFTTNSACDICFLILFLLFLFRMTVRFETLNWVCECAHCMCLVKTLSQQ